MKAYITEIELSSDWPESRTVVCGVSDENEFRVELKSPNQSFCLVPNGRFDEYDIDMEITFKVTKKTPKTETIVFK